METEVDVMKEVLIETESEKETIEARNQELMSQLDLLVEDQVKFNASVSHFMCLSACYVFIMCFGYFSKVILFTSVDRHYTRIKGFSKFLTTYKIFVRPGKR